MLPFPLWIKLHSEKRDKKSPLIESTANMENNQPQKTFKKWVNGEGRLCFCSEWNSTVATGATLGIWGKIIMCLNLLCSQSTEVDFPPTAKRRWLLSQRKMHPASSLWNKKKPMRRTKERRMSQAAPAKKTRRMTLSRKGRLVRWEAYISYNCTVLAVCSNVR